MKHNGALYALKVTDIADVMRHKNGRHQYDTERRLHQTVASFPFLVVLCYLFRTKSKLCLILGEYIKNYSSFHDV
jgi:hypothetical protein